MKNKLTDWLDTEWHGVPRTIWVAAGFIAGIILNLVVISLL